MDRIDALAELFRKFPGVGPRQATRFVHFLLRASPAYRALLRNAIDALSAGVAQCVDCQRFHDADGERCARCTDTTRDKSVLMVVTADQDQDAIERSRAYRGTYFVLGGLVHVGSDTQPHLREAALLTLLRRKKETLEEVVCALPAHPEGDLTAAYVKDLVHAELPTLRFSMLGRGLSTGSEIEYADPDTLAAALSNRH